MILLHLIQKIEETYTGGRAKWTRHHSNKYPPDSWRKKQWPKFALGWWAQQGQRYRVHRKKWRWKRLRWDWDDCLLRIAATKFEVKIHSEQLIPDRKSVT